MAYDWTTDPLATSSRRRRKKGAYSYSAQGRGPTTPVAGNGPIIPGDPALENPPILGATGPASDPLADPLSRWKDRTGSDLLAKFQGRYPDAQYDASKNWGQNVSSWAHGTTGQPEDNGFIPASQFTGPRTRAGLPDEPIAPVVRPPGPPAGATGTAGTAPVDGRWYAPSPHRDTGPYGGNEDRSRRQRRRR